MQSLNTSLAQPSTRNPYLVQSSQWDDPPQRCLLLICLLPVAFLLTPAAPLSAAPSPWCQVEVLGNRFRCIAIDLPGHGASSHLPMPPGWRPEDVAVAVHAKLETLGLAKGTRGSERNARVVASTEMPCSFHTSHGRRAEDTPLSFFSRVQNMHGWRRHARPSSFPSLPPTFSLPPSHCCPCPLFGCFGESWGRQYHSPSHPFPLPSSPIITAVPPPLRLLWLE